MSRSRHVPPRHPTSKEAPGVRRVQRRRLRRRALARLAAGQPERIERERGTQGWDTW